MTKNQMRIDSNAITEYLSRNPDKLEEYEVDMPSNKRKIFTEPLAVLGIGFCVAIASTMFGAENDGAIGCLCGSMIVGAVYGFCDALEVYKERKSIIKNAKLMVEGEA